ncbi:Transcriptional regulatory protein, C terminal [Amycolatopsis xylanica]|uniref:Transcriptional regulatory protein, C terminal n=1 Tax=Amycolatopsis xylanica TaxID=589385 RepID=A0A1H2S0W7_9PSEU|nr:BTAD domain-containing putative transcriptional regulator [Amycolatopsis xylanica]SDW25165.1 Transcriptional regulatory protein, C terminal [Amycolatopsis xylanica]
MEFKVLGALEIVDETEIVELSGVKQRAVLGYLLLHANKVVPMSHVVKALWGADVPPSARKMVQNAVSALRRMLATASSEAPVLLTHAPGYLLRLEPESLDLHRFQRLVDQARGDLAAGSAQQAATALRAALALWRGPALSDLVETGLNWSELSALEIAKLGAVEDCFEAELACGRHHEVLAELAEFAVREPRRERLCGQLMVALYRAGRQAEALDVYQRTQALLVHDLGIEPGRELRKLQSMIVSQDLALTAHPQPVAVAPSPDVSLERKQVSVLLVHVGAPADTDPEDVNDALPGIAAVVGEEVRRFGGVGGGTIGSMFLALFGVPRNHENDAERAVRAALAIRDRLDGAEVRMAVSTGGALTRFQRDDAAAPPVVTGAVVDTALLLLGAPGSIVACEATRRAAEGQIVFDGALAVSPAETRGAGAGTLVGRVHELQLMRSLLGQVRDLRRPHLLTVLGRPGIGKSRLVAEFGRQVCANREAVACLTGFTSPFATESPYLPLTAMIGEPDADLAAWCRFVEATATDGPIVVVLEDLHWADDVLLAAVETLTDRLPSVPLLVIATARPELLQRRPAWGGGRRHTTMTTLDPLSEHATAEILLDLASREGADRAGLPELCDALAGRAGGIPLFAAEYAKMLAEFPRRDDFPVPAGVHSVLASQVDMLSSTEKTVLLDASVLPEPFSAQAVASVGRRDEAEVAGAMTQLERLGFLRRSGGGYVFEHPLVREVACAQLPRSERADKKQRALVVGSS